jgi:hypothetical protein
MKKISREIHGKSKNPSSMKEEMMKIQRNRKKGREKSREIQKFFFCSYYPSIH